MSTPFDIESFEEYLDTVRKELPGDRHYYRGQSKKITDGFALKPSLGRYEHLKKLRAPDRETSESAPALAAKPMGESRHRPAPRLANPIHGLDDQPLGRPLFCHPRDVD